MKPITIGVNAWSAWAPATEGADNYGYWQGSEQQLHFEQPQLSHIPAMQRRRLGPLARVVFHVLEQCVGEQRDCVTLFSSSMGEIHRTQDILTSIAKEEPVSPAKFSLSVHNAIAGQWSLIHQLFAPQIALAPADASPIPALLEAYSYLRSGEAETVYMVCYEEDYPAFYQPFLDSPPAPTALALQLCAAKNRRALQLELTPAQGASEHAAGGFLGLTPALAGAGEVTLGQGNNNWVIRQA